MAIIKKEKQRNKCCSRKQYVYKSIQ